MATVAGVCGQVGTACAIATCGADVQALHVTTHASDGESAWDEKKGSHSASGHILHVGRPDASYNDSQKMSEVKWISSCMESNT